MLFNYRALDQTGQAKEGAIEAVSKDLAITALQRRGLIVLSVMFEDVM